MSQARMHGQVKFIALWEYPAYTAHMVVLWIFYKENMDT